LAAEALFYATKAHECRLRGQRDAAACWRHATIITANRIIKYRTQEMNGNWLTPEFIEATRYINLTKAQKEQELADAWFDKLVAEYGLDPQAHARELARRS
jgi:hypothetical protein